MITKSTPVDHKNPSNKQSWLRLSVMHWVRSLSIFVLALQLSGCLSTLPVRSISPTLTPPVPGFDVPGSEVDPSQFVLADIVEDNTSGFGSVHINLKNVSDHDIEFASYEPAYIFVRTAATSQWNLVTDELADVNGSSVLKLSALSKQDGMELAQVVLNLSLPASLPTSALVRVVFVGKVVGLPDIGSRIVIFVDIDSTNFGWNTPDIELVPLVTVTATLPGTK